MAASLASAWWRTSPVASPVSAANPTTTSPGWGRAWETAARTSTVRTRRSTGASTPSVFLILVPATASGRKSATAAAMTRTSAGPVPTGPAVSAAPPRAVTTAVCSSAAVPTRVVRTPAGRGTSTWAATRWTSAPRSRAASASAIPCRPDEALPRNRTGSSGSRVPPALTTTRRPARSPVRADDRRARTWLSRSSGSGSRPGPESEPVSRPAAGSTTTTPRERSVATLARVAGCCHISVCMAGARSTGQVAVSSVLVSRSSARPCAARASRSAVAGATTTRSAVRPMATCGTSCASLHTSVTTGWPDSADHVGSPTKRSAASVGTTVTSWPSARSRRSRVAALYAAIPPATPRTTRRPISPRGRAGWA